MARRMTERRTAGLSGRGAATVRTLMVLAGVGLLASCAAAPTPATKFSESKYGVKASPKVASGKRTPKGGGYAMVGKPYRVAGKTYVPRDDPNYSAVGLASWYGPNFHGRKTANGEVFNQNDLTAAHPTLPLPSYVRVTNLKNDRSVVVRVNDRGPFAHGRVIDVSSAAASMLDFKRSGVAKVKVEYVGPARMDGRDRRTLMASYSGPGKRPRTMLASRNPSPKRAEPVTAPVVVAAAPNEPAAIGPSPTGFDDPIGPLILRSGFVSSYAEPRQLTAAHAAAADLGRKGDIAARPQHPEPDRRNIVVQLGVFADPANAARVGAMFRKFGRVDVVRQSRDGRALRIVKVAISDRSTDPARVIAAAESAGLSGAYIVRP